MSICEEYYWKHFIKCIQCPSLVYVWLTKWMFDVRKYGDPYLYEIRKLVSFFFFPKKEIGVLQLRYFDSKLILLNLCKMYKPSEWIVLQ